MSAPEPYRSDQERATAMASLLRQAIDRGLDAARKALQRGVLDLSASMVLVMALGFGQNFVLARLLGAAALGHMAVINSVLTVAGLVATAGVTTSILRYGAAERSRAGAWAVYRRGLGLVTWVSVISTALCAAFALSPFWVFDPVAGDWMPIVALLLPLQALTSCALAFLQARDRMRDKALLELLVRAVSVGGVLVGALVWGFPGAVVGFVLGMGSASIAPLLRVRDLREPGGVPSVPPRELLRFGAWGLLTNALALVLTTADVLSVSAFVKDAAAVGVYSLASLFQQVVTIPMRAYLDARFPEMTRASGDPIALRAMRRRMRLHLLLITAAPAALLAALAPILLPWIFGAEFAASVRPLWILLVGQILWSLGSAQGRSMLAAGWVEGNFWGAGAAAAFAVTANLTLVPRFGAIGAAISTASTNAFFGLVLAVICRWYENGRVGTVR